MNLITPDTGLLFWMVVIFGLLFFLLAKFGFPLITSMVEERNAKIEKSLREAEEIERRLKETVRKQKKILAEASAEQARMIAEAGESRREIIDKAREDAKVEAEKILSTARKQIAEEKEAALRDIRREVAVVSVAVAERIIRDSLASSKDQTDYLDKIVDEACAEQRPKE